MPAPAPEIAASFELAFPMTIKGVMYSELNARRPKVRDLKALTMNADKDPIGAYNRFLAGLLTVPVEVIDELDLEDFNKMKSWVNDFLPKSADATS